MANVKASDVISDVGHKITTWTPMTEADTGLSVSVGGQFSDKTVQVFGNFGTSGAITMEGTNDSAESSWASLHDPQGNAIVLTTNALKLIAEQPLRIRPRATAGTGMSVTVVVVASD